MITVQWSDPYTLPMMKFWHLWAIFEWVPVDLEFKNGTSMSEAHCYEISVYPFLTFRWVKDICKKIFQLTIFFSFYCRQIMSYLCQKCKRLDHWFCFRDKACGKLPWFCKKKLAHTIIQHGRFIIKDIKGESTETNSLKHIL